jgi:hypothetical protein
MFLAERNLRRIATEQATSGCESAQPYLLPWGELRV